MRDDDQPAFEIRERLPELRISMSGWFVGSSSNRFGRCDKGGCGAFATEKRDLLRTWSPRMSAAEVIAEDYSLRWARASQVPGDVSSRSSLGFVCSKREGSA